LTQQGVRTSDLVQEDAEGRGDSLGIIFLARIETHVEIGHKFELFTRQF